MKTVESQFKEENETTTFMVIDEMKTKEIRKCLSVKILNKSKHDNPTYTTEGSAGMDLRANIEYPMILGPNERLAIPTGIHIQLPLGYEAQIRPRSGLAIKSGIGMANSVGTIDSDYIGEIKAILINHSNEPFVINNGDRIAQMVVAKHEYVNWNSVEILDDTERGSGGFGHSGVK